MLHFWGQCLQAGRAAWSIHGLQKLTETRFPQELWGGGVGSCRILGFFPLTENIQPPWIVPEHPKAFSIFMGLFFSFFRMDTVKSQEGPGVLDLHSQGEEMWIKCLVKAKKRRV